MCVCVAPICYGVWGVDLCSPLLPVWTLKLTLGLAAVATAAGAGPWQQSRPSSDRAGSNYSRLSHSRCSPRLWANRQLTSRAAVMQITNQCVEWFTGSALSAPPLIYWAGALEENALSVLKWEIRGGSVCKMVGGLGQPRGKTSHFSLFSTNSFLQPCSLQCFN